jgi:hypothetical protein
MVTESNRHLCIKTIEGIIGMNFFSFQCSNTNCGYIAPHLLNIRNHKKWGICKICNKGVLLIINNLVVR